ncbi:MAG: hypothetical protein M1827_007763 [Pycnora praestabilis]|nr:MAG: hypothetical protein M1827_007763 [Pycnora praestabilis]
MSEPMTPSETVSLQSGYHAGQQRLRSKDEETEVLKGQVVNLTREIKTIEWDKVLQQDENCALKVEIRSYQEELMRLKSKVQDLERNSLRETPIKDIGREVRIRYLERHRQRMGKSIGKVGYDHIKSGDRAAHRGRPLADAWLYQVHQISDQDVYKDLYGITPGALQEWKDISGIVDISGFHASLQSEDKLSNRFRALFGQFLKVATAYSSPTELRMAFIEDKLLQRKQDELQDCYDEIISANHPKQRTASS